VPDARRKRDRALLVCGEEAEVISQLEHLEKSQLSVGLHTEVARSARRIQRIAEALFRETDILDQSTEKIVKAIRSGLIPAPGSDEHPISRQGSSSVARDFSITHCDDGAFEFRFKMGFPFPRTTLRLAPQRGGLLEFLSSGAPAEDGLVGWRSEAEVLEYLTRESQTKQPRRYMAGLIFQLRQSLSKEGLNRNLIQLNKRQGIRFTAEPPRRDD
jgi:hypothetical protein